MLQLGSRGGAPGAGARHVRFHLGHRHLKAADSLRAVVRDIPLERLLVETDAPYLAPIPHRGKRNEPAYVAVTAAAVAALKGVSPDELAAATTENFFRLFAKATRPAAGRAGI